MKPDDRYSIVINEHISGYQKVFTSYLYNLPEFLALKEGYKPVYCELLDLKEKTVLMQAIFLCDDITAVSLPQAPFGGIHYRHVSIGKVRNFVLKIIAYFTSRDFKRIIIKNPADIYNQEQNTIIANCLVNAGFVISNFDINHHIDIDQTAFSKKIHKMENRKLNGAIKAELDFREVAGKEIAGVYDFISECRDEKKTNMNITFDQLDQAVNRLPEKYKFFIATFHGKIIAATVAVFAHDSILYNYLPASSLAYNKLSPMVFLLHGLYDYCRSKEVKILDLGISSLDNKPQESLILFKERVGGRATLKLTFQLSLA